VTITYRASPSGKLRAAYLGNCRVGYVEYVKKELWIWQLNLIAPAGSIYSGVANSEQNAKQSLTEAVNDWLENAGLQTKQEN
jgi:hypothetical protein